MSKVLYLDTISDVKTVDENIKRFSSLNQSVVKHFRNLSDLIIYLCDVGSSDLDLDYPSVFIINEHTLTNRSRVLHEGIQKTPLNILPYDEIYELLKHHYKHFNPLIYKLNEFSITKINKVIDDYHKVLKNRILRMKSWTGLNNENTKKCPCLHSMTNCLNTILQKDYQISNKLINYVSLINQDIDFFKILSLPKPLEYYLYCIGNWGFIAQELTCDITYCAFQIFKISFGIIKDNDSLLLKDNEIFSFLFSLRDSYRGGNNFHNFRHAVDVLQATFYFLLSIEALPKFPYYTNDYQIHPRDQMNSNYKYQGKQDYNHDNSLLHPIQTLALLVSSIGHDVGHPGLTNPFLINNESPIAKIYSNQSVLEHYHLTIFQDILSFHWPSFLKNEFTNEKDSPLNTKTMQIESILATDMANHFEYLHKINQVSELLENPEQRPLIKDSLKHTNVILSLIIKCADISNVSRPLFISTKWAVVLGREFSEIAQLENNLNKGISVDELDDPRLGPHFPITVKEAVDNNPSLPKGQLFFINTFAEALFKEVCTVLPELKFSSELVQKNKQFWENVESDSIDLSTVGEYI
ncbi:cAMP-specific 3',5'-cyclic phosphodiesterase 4A [Wickerhamomyces ciferrii]|uniref:Phosphodiesterase n=1 Tax=Wickerhamomyces ciferrii (strain ATCC 14091 / BCRC 22168 / CBS 111 / JCM 3599 / NBRC 0793 / NRRL Y-1031 F-60-10) TaxID=1206466 RepID=K0KQG9_WICCF|nr:cAMP-specific 3',5'-cyclic phosphodiesterase 4A [Wickerhamomyces ciferrii]CCH45276.1 cAMP-specific 3',5'-cyclic phosphodiesterase 4A [Wickerhamomyces ciferrii]